MQTPKIPPPCFAFLNSELLEISEGRTVVRFSPTDEMTNPYGSIQGGILAGMLDNIIGPSVVSVAPGRASATIQMSVSYLAAARPGEALVGTATVIKHGKLQAVVDAEIHRESDGVMVVRATATNVFMGEVESVVPSIDMRK
jgi:uncharacterized protein (TIGR00369 family)